jgi:O-6-methylguanine DNA methyltransferase
VNSRRIRAERAEAELDEYFAGARRSFTLPLATPGPPFQQQVWQRLLAIPYGATASYSEIARAIGRPEGVRAVARANGDNRLAIVIPCHRVIGADGKLTGYGGGLWRKRVCSTSAQRRGRGGRCRRGGRRGGPSSSPSVRDLRAASGTPVTSALGCGQRMAPWTAIGYSRWPLTIVRRRDFPNPRAGATASASFGPGSRDRAVTVRRGQVPRIAQCVGRCRGPFACAALDSALYDVVLVLPSFVSGLDNTSPGHQQMVNTTAS